MHKITPFNNFHHFLLLFIVLIGGVLTSYSQCPTVTDPIQSFCNVPAPMVSNLVANDTGGGILWYASATSTTPLSNTALLINGNTYYAGDNSGLCGARESVTVSILGPPFGLNFQGVCVDDPNDATLADLFVVGNDVRWYNVPVGGTALPPSTVLTNTIYYADQANPITGCRTSRLTVSVNVVVVAVPTGDSLQQFCDDPNSPPTIADLVASGNNNWYASSASATPLDISTHLVDGEKYYATTVISPCESVGRFEVLVNLTPPNDSGQDGTISICEMDVSTIHTIDLFSVLGGTPWNDGLWTGPRTVMNGNLGTVDISGMTVAGSPYVFTYTVNSSSLCPPSSSTVSIVIMQESNAGIDGFLDLCIDDDPVDLFTMLGGTPQAGGMWNPPLSSGTGVFNPSIDTSGIYTYTVSGTPPCSDNSATVTVNVNSKPNAGIDSTLNLCSMDSTVDLFGILGGTPDPGGVWTPALASGSGIFSPSIDAPGVYTYTVLGTPPCSDDSAIVIVNLTRAPDAGLDGVVDLCSNGAPVDLFTLLGGTPEIGGIWSPALSSGTGIFDPQLDPAGVYTYTVSGTSPCGNATANVTVTVVAAPNAGQDGSIDLCENDGQIDLFTVLGGTPEIGGTWSPALSSGSGIFDPQLDVAGVYTYTVNGTLPCGNDTANVTVAIIAAPDAGLDGTIDLCSNGSPVDLFTLLGGTPEIGGTWSPSLSSGTGIFDPQLDPAGVYTYTVIGTSPCGNATANVTVTVVAAPNAGQDGSIDLCESDGQIDLFTVLGGTPEIGGTWSPALSSGSGIFDPQLDVAGIYTYTVNGTLPCGNDTAKVTVAIIAAPDAGLDGTIDLCSNGAPVDLFTLLGGTPEIGGTWSPALSSGTGIFDPQLDPAGVYTYTVIGTSPCGNATANVTVTVVVAPNAGQDGSIDLCENDGQIDLFTVLGGTPDTGGTWSPALSSGSGIFDPQIDVAGVYTYTVNGTLPCGNDTANVTVAIIAAPDAGLDGTIDLCSNGSPVDLFTLLSGTPEIGGNWSPALSSGTGIFDPQLDPAGVYTYTVIGTSPCGNATANVTVTVVAAPNAGQDGSIDLCENDGQIDLFTVLGGTPEIGGTWSPALSSGSGIFDPQLDVAGVYTYTVNGTLPCGNDTANVTVAIIDAPDVGLDGVVDLCSNGAPVDLFTLLGGTPEIDGTWSPSLSSGTGIFDPQLDPAGVYTYTVSGTSPCGNATANVTVTVVAAPNAGQDGSIDLCENDGQIDLFTVLGGTPEIGGTWSPTLSSGSGIFDPQLDVAGVYTYTVNGTLPCGNDTANVTVAIIAAPDAGLDGTIDLCSNGSPVDLFTLLGGTPEIGGTWSPALSSGTGIFDPQLDPAGVYTYTVNGTSPCGNATANVTVTVVAAPNAGQDGSIDLCESDGQIDLFTVLGGTPEIGGTWSPTLSSGSGIFDPQLDVAGIYTYTVNGTLPCGNDTAKVTVAIIDAPDAGLDGTIDLCSNGSPVDLFTLLGGTPEIGGTWSPSLSSGTGIFDPQLDPAGVYTYTVIGTSPCGNATANVTVTVVAAPNAGQDGSIDLCENDGQIDLFTVLGGTPDTGGTWSPALSSGSGIFDPQLDVAGVYTYTVNGTLPCGNDTANVTVAIIAAPDAGLDGTIDLCSNGSPVDLFTLLGGTPEIGGTWSPALSSGTGIFDPQLDPAGVYTYTVIGTSPCGNATANVTVTVVAAPNAGQDGSIDLCESDGQIDLFTVLGGTPDTGGIWSPALSSGSGIFDPQLDVAGVYTYTVNGTLPCGNDTANVTVAIIAAPDAGLDGTIDLCSNGSPVDLFTLLGGTPEIGGTWSPALSSGTGIFDPQLDPAGVYTYTVIGTSPCGNATANVTVTVVAALNAGQDGSIDLCENDGQIDLFTVLGGTPEIGGTWSPALSSGSGIFDPQIDVAGVYTYTVNGTLPCGNDTAKVTVAIIAAPDAGLDGTIDLCSNGSPVDLFTLLGGTPEIGGTWSPSLSSGTGIFDPQLDPAGVYTYTVIGTSPCGNATANVTVTVVAAPNAGQDGSIDLCESDGQIDLFTVLGGTPDTGGTWSPALSSGSGIFDPQLDVAGVYTYTVNGTLPCGNDTAKVTVAIIAAPDAGLDGTIDLCSNGSPVDLFALLGGTPEIGGTWSPALSSGTGIFDPQLDPAGVYTYTVIGTSPCGNATANVTVTVVAAPNAGQDGSINLCESDGQIDLFTVLGGTPDTGGTWSPALSSGSGIFDPQLDVAGVYTYTLVGTPPCGSDSAEVIVTITSIPDVSGAVMTASDPICINSSNEIEITGADFLTDGLYTLNYELTGANLFVGSIDVTFNNGATIFIIPASQLGNTGLTTLTINNLFLVGNSCEGDVSSIESIQFTIETGETPALISNGNEFCINENPTIAHLSANIVDQASIVWYDAPINGDPYPENFPLVNGETYYASTTSINGCESSVRLEVTVSLIYCHPSVVIPDGFSPNGDGINDTFIIKNLRELYPNFTLEIYNRYGNVLYKGNRNSPDWDGSSNTGVRMGSSELPVGVYFYILNYNQEGKDSVQGRVYLSR